MQEQNFGPVRFIPGQSQGRYPFCNSIYIEGAKILIDPASDRERLVRLREQEGVAAVWLSHWHEDHITDLDLFEDLPLWIAEADAPPLADLETFLDWYDMDDQEFRASWRQTMAEQFHYRPRRPTGFLAAGASLAPGGVEVELVPAPGHTPGSLAFYFPQPRVLFMADYDLTNFGPWYGDRYSSIPDTINSVGRLRQVPARVWLAGHEKGVFTSPPGELWDRYLAVIEQREAKLRRLLASPRTLAEIVEARIVYGRPREPKAFYDFGEKAIMTKHLTWLELKGELRQKGEHYRLV